MRTALAIVGVFAATLALAADANDDAVKKELDKFNGTWKAVSVVHDGKEVPKEDLDKVTLTVKGNEYTFRHGDVMVEGTHKLDPTKTPKNHRRHAHQRPGPGQDPAGHLRTQRRRHVQGLASPRPARTGRPSSPARRSSGDRLHRHEA